MIGDRRGAVAAIAVLVAVVAATASLLTGCGGDDEQTLTIVDDPDVTSADYDFYIPEGTGKQLDRGEPVEILPGTLEVRVGEVIRIVNDDDRGHLVGPFFVGAHETLTQRFTSPGEFIGACSVHPSGQLVLEVRE